jgi:hypothetical protein
MTAQNVGRGGYKKCSDSIELGANDIHAENMMDIDIDAMGFRAGPEGHPNATQRAHENDKDKAEGRRQEQEGARHGARSTEDGGDIRQEGTRRR